MSVMLIGPTLTSVAPMSLNARSSKGKVPFGGLRSDREAIVQAAE